MGQKYDQFDLDDRIELFRLREDGKAPSEIARIMDRHRSTIGRELKRNSLPRGDYKPASAERMAWARRRRQSKIERLPPLRDLVRGRLSMGWSAEQIAGRLRRDRSEHRVCHETIYRYVYRPKVRGEKLYRFFPRAKAARGRRYFKRRRDPIPNKRSIHQRPQSIGVRTVFGHWEADLMQFRTQRGNLLTLCERKTRFTLTAPLQTKSAVETSTALEEILSRLPAAARQSLTLDNGSEFAHHENLETALGIRIYFCDPHSPWQRGTIENTNGLLRRDLPRKTNITDYTDQDIDDLTWALNSTPRKCLGFKTPAEAFLDNLKCVALEM